jgi:hypothetical protein
MGRGVADLAQSSGHRRGTHHWPQLLPGPTRVSFRTAEVENTFANLQPRRLIVFLLKNKRKQNKHHRSFWKSLIFDTVLYTFALFGNGRVELQLGLPVWCRCPWLGCVTTQHICRVFLSCAMQTSCLRIRCVTNARGVKTLHLTPGSVLKGRGAVYVVWGPDVGILLLLIKLSKGLG